MEAIKHSKTKIIYQFRIQIMFRSLRNYIDLEGPFYFRGSVWREILEWFRKSLCEHMGKMSSKREENKQHFSAQYTAVSGVNGY